MRSQLLALLKPFSGRLVRPPARGKYGEYVSHYVIEQRLLSVVGAFSWEITQTIRDSDGMLTGCVGRITASIDGSYRSADGAGDVENRRAVTDDGKPLVQSDGAALKLAESDAFKRAAMRLGVGLHLWAGDDFYIYDLLVKDSDAKPIPSEGEAVSDDAEPVSAVGSAVS